MAGYVLKMNTLVSNINHRGQKDLSFKVRHKAYACPLCGIIEVTIIIKVIDKRATQSDF